MKDTFRYAVALLTSLVSLSAAGWSIKMDMVEEQLLDGLSLQQLAPLPVTSLPAGLQLPPKVSPLTETERKSLIGALVADPLDQALVNILYVDAIKTNQHIVAASYSALLSQLGWRTSLAQINLMLQAATDENYRQVVDRADGLLRRQAFVPMALSLIFSMEAIPQVQGLVVRKLLGSPEWRGLYLSAISPAASASALSARIRTMQLLLQARQPVSRLEIAPTLAALLANGRGKAAYGLWTQWTGLQRSANVVADGQFHRADELAGTSNLLIPFEWQFKQDLGYTAQPSSVGVSVSWDGRGVPVFITQLVPVRSGAHYLLMIEGNADHRPLGTLFAPTLTCNQQTVAFTPIASSLQRAQFRSDVVPADCELATLAVSGRVDVAAGEIAAEFHRLTLTQLD